MPAPHDTRPCLLRLAAAAGCLAVALAGCTTSAGSSGPPASGAGAGSGSALGASSPASPASPDGSSGGDGRPFAVTPAGEFDEPWAMAFLPDGDLLITERGGELKLRDQASGGVRTVVGTPEVAAAGQGGLGDVVLSPTFARDGTIYLSWAEAGDGGTAGAVIGTARLERSESGASLAGLRVIWRQTPKVSGTGHFGHRLAFSADGRFLFVTSGERQKMEPAQDFAAASGGNLGKVLRLNLDGTPAAGNPFVSRDASAGSDAGSGAESDAGSGAGSTAAQVWSFGHRNPLGLAFDGAGNLWSSEMGPQGGDELNLVRSGLNYGWPRVSNGSHYGGAEIPDHADGDGYAAPAVSWNPSVSPGSLMIYGVGTKGEAGRSGSPGGGSPGSAGSAGGPAVRGSTGSVAFPAWRGDAFIGALSGQALIRVDIGGDAANPTATKAEQWDMGARIREVEEGPDGTIWLLEDGAGGRLLHLTPPR